jgi:hypothetical protein
MRLQRLGNPDKMISRDSVSLANFLRRNRAIHVLAQI